MPPQIRVVPHEKAQFPQTKKPGPWTIWNLGKTRFRDIFVFSQKSIFHWWRPPRTFYKKNSIKKDFHAIEKKIRGYPPSPEGGGGVPPFRAVGPELNQPLKSKSRRKKNVNRGNLSYATLYWTSSAPYALELIPCKWPTGGGVPPQRGLIEAPWLPPPPDFSALRLP